MNESDTQRPTVNEVSGAILAVPTETLPQRWLRLWRDDPEAVALVDLTGQSERNLRRSDLDTATVRAAGALHKLGVRPGDRVLLSGSPSPALVVCYVAILRLGAVVVPANTGYLAAELSHIVSDSEPVLALVDDNSRVANLNVRSASIDEVASNHDASAPPAASTGSEDLAMIAYTSGTTGRPKGAMLTHRNLLSSADALRQAWEWKPDDGLLLTLPLFHLHGLGVGINGSLSAGAKVVLCRSFDAATTLTHATRPDVTLFFGVPTMFSRLQAAISADPSAAQALASLRLLVSGSAPLPGDLWSELRNSIGQEVLERYGMTETVMLVSNPYVGERRPGSVGLPLPGVTVRLGDSDEILVRGPNVSTGYWRNEEATRASFTADGFFRTGDIGEWSDDGYLSIVGRAKELIITGGYNVYPREVEEVLTAHPAVKEAAVLGAPSPEWGERIVALVVPADRASPPTLEQLAAYCAERIAGYKKPRGLVLVDALPRNSMGKIARTELRPLI